ncbi:MAG: energy transducer TonB [Bacteroidota bacterium]|nr:energy transducer TonB [Bacteroidota bacterium]
MKILSILILASLLSLNGLCQSRIGYRSINQQHESDTIKRFSYIGPEYKKRGYKGFYKYVDRNLINPEVAKEKKIEGKVFVKFIITESEQVDPNSVEIVKGLEESLDQEAIRLIKGSGEWKPGTKDGIPVKMNHLLPIAFRLKHKKMNFIQKALD